MRLKLFLASLLACGFIAYAIANENISNAEIESIATTPKTNTDKNVKIQQKQQLQQTKQQPKMDKLLDKSEAIEMIEIVKPKITNGNISLARSGALQMFDDYLGELGYEVTDSGYNW
ncbi:hypothetical protein DOY81_013007, partial [Sarcophaga bullata]